MIRSFDEINEKIRSGKVARGHRRGSGGHGEGAGRQSCF